MRKIKDSGVAWIGVIPENWQLLSVGALFKDLLIKVKP